MDDRHTILIADDDFGCRELAAETILDSYGNLVNVITASHAEECMKIVRREHPAVAVIDYQLPGMNGLELIAQITKISPETGFVLASAIDRETLKSIAQSNPLIKVVSKPYQPIDLEKAVAGYLMLRKDALLNQ